MFVTAVTTIVFSMVKTGGRLKDAGKVRVAGSRKGGKLRAVVTMGFTAFVTCGYVCSAFAVRRWQVVVCSKSRIWEISRGRSHGYNFKYTRGRNRWLCRTLGNSSRRAGKVRVAGRRKGEKLHAVITMG